MTLVDTSVWVEHLRSGEPHLAALLEEGEVLGHPFVAGELACGRLRQREEILGFLSRLPAAVVATHEEALALVESEALEGSGVGWLDVHLLASARLSGAGLWTVDRRLARVAGKLGLTG